MRQVVHHERSPAGEQQARQGSARSRHAFPQHGRLQGCEGGQSQADISDQRNPQRISAGQDQPCIIQGLPVGQGEAIDKFDHANRPWAIGGIKPRWQEISRMRQAGQERQSQQQAGDNGGDMEQRHGFGIGRRDHAVEQQANANLRIGEGEDQQRGQAVGQRVGQVQPVHGVIRLSGMGAILGRPGRAGYAILRCVLPVLMMLMGHAMAHPRAQGQVGVLPGALSPALVQTPGPIRSICADPATAANLTTLGQRILEDSVALRFGQARGLVPEFSAWAYDWTQSYFTAYNIAGRGLLQLGEAALGRAALPNAETITHAMAVPVRAAFLERVTRPSLGDGRFDIDMAYLATTLAHEARDPALGERLALALRLNPAERLSEAAGSETVFLRSIRPMAARLGALVLRLSEAGSVVAVGGYLGYGLVGTPGMLAGTLGGVGLAWGVDWAINRVDATLHRPAFEAQAMVAIDAAEASVIADGRGAIAKALAACR